MYIPRRRANIVASSAVLVISSIVIYGWITNNISIIKISPTFPPMQFNTASCLFLLAVANLIPRKTKISFIRCIISMFVLILAFSTLMEYLLAVNLHIDNIIFHKDFDNSLYPGRMSPNTAVCFTLLAIANTFPRVKNNALLVKNLYSTLHGIVALITLTALFGYLLDISYYFSWGYITGMALHTSVCLLLLSLTKFSFQGIKYIGQRIGIVVSIITFTVFFLFWLYATYYDDEQVNNKVDKGLTLLHTNLERKLNLEYRAIDRLHKRLVSSSYSSIEAILADFQAYEDDYPSIYFIYYNKNSEDLFLSNYKIDKSQALNILAKCDVADSTKQKLICIQDKQSKFNVVFRPNFSSEFINQINNDKYNIEIYLEGEKIYSNLALTDNYTFKVSKTFNGAKNWKIIAFFTTEGYEDLQKLFPSLLFLFGVLISFMTQIFFHLLNINSRKNKILNINEQRLTKLSSTDSLTNCINRHTLIKQLSLMLKSDRVSDSKFAVLFIDLDNFKYINDTYGHDAGDTILIEVVNRLKENLREEDLIARIGGDEFIAVLKNLDDKNTIINILDRTIESMEQEIKINSTQKIVQSISIGVTIQNRNNKNDVDGIIKQADEAMYIAKNKGKNQYCFG